MILIKFLKNRHFCSEKNDLRNRINESLEFFNPSRGKVFKKNPKLKEK